MKRFSLLFINLALTLDILMFFLLFTVLLQLSSVVAVCWGFHVFILCYTIFLLVLFLLFLILLFNLSSQIVLFF